MYPGRNSSQYGSGAPGFRMPSPNRDVHGYAPPPQPPARYNQYDPPPRGEELPIGYFPSYDAPPERWQGRGYAAPPLPPGHPPSFAFSPPPGPPPDVSGPGQYTSYVPPQGPPPPRQYGDGPPPVPQRDHRYRGPSSGPAPLPPTGIQNYGPQTQGPGNQSIQPYFEYSRCTGKKRALCIGINYFGQDAELKGCINDARNVQQFLLQRGFTEKEMVILTDDARNPRSTPTKQNMLDAMQWLVKDARPNDSLFFHYSGHGGRTKDLDGDEADGFDEVIYPVDFKQAGHIVDDDMHAIMVRPLPPGCRLTAIYDCCHSGSALDLPYTYSTEGKIKEPNLTAEAGKDLLGLAKSYAMHDVGGMMQGAKGLFRLATGSNKKAEDYARATRTSPADVISWSGCKDTQTSADTFEAGKATGAMSYAFMACLGQKPNQSYQELLINIRELLRQKYSQKPQLSSSHPIDTNLAFLF